MHISELHLRNFRNFESQSFQFPTLFTVIVGDNGKGKSSILQGLRLAAGTFLLGLDEPERLHIQKEDVRRVDVGKRFAPQKDCSFEAVGEINGAPCSWKRTLHREGGRTDYKQAYQLIDIAAELNRRVNIELVENLDLPVICFFSTARLWAESKQTINLKKKGSKIKDGYARCLDLRSDRVSPLEWIKSHYIKQLKGKENGGLLEAVLEAIATCIPNWEPSEWDEDTDDLAGSYTQEDGSNIYMPLYYLSDGLRTMAVMVAEIAYRCVVLNDHLGRDAVKKSRGIVMIDELDMHVHPNWQRHVVGDLKNAFPNIQFVATTHSPFIVQSLQSNELINLDFISDVSPNILKVDEVATEIMGVESAFALENQKKFDTAKQFLTDLEGQRSQDNLEAQIESISDPGLRAFLELNKMAKGK